MNEQNNTKSDYTLRQLLIRRLLIVGLVISVLTSVEDLIVYKSFLRSLPLFGLNLAFILCIFVSRKYNNVEFGARFICVVTVFFVFPYIFFTNGAIEGGSSIWFVLGIFYIIGMLNGAEMVAYLVVAIAIDAACYIVSYMHPETVVQLSGRHAVYIDSLYEVITVSLFIGIVTKYQI